MEDRNKDSYRRDELDTPSAPVELTEAELKAVAGGLNPQPLPPEMRFTPVPIPW